MIAEKDTISALHNRLLWLETRQASENQNSKNLFVHLQCQVSAIQVAATISYMHVDKESSLQGSEGKQFISYKLITILKQRLRTRVGLSDKHFSSVLWRYPSEMSKAIFETLTYVSLDVASNAQRNNKLFFPTSALCRGALGSCKNVNVAFKSC